MFDYVVDFEVGGHADWVMLRADGWELAMARFTWWCRENLVQAPMNVSVYRADTATCCMDFSPVDPVV